MDTVTSRLCFTLTEVNKISDGVLISGGGGRGAGCALSYAFAPPGPTSAYTPTPQPNPGQKSLPQLILQTLQTTGVLYPSMLSEHPIQK